MQTWWEDTGLQKWEYMIVRLDSDRIRWVNQRELRDWETHTDHLGYLNELGGRGWELAASDSGGASFSNAVLIFKRPKL